MLITTKVELDLQKSNYPPTVSVVQGDTNTRAVEVILNSGDSPWEIPAGVMVAMRYRKPDMTGGYYDTMPDGTKAWSIRENVVTMQLAPQMLTVAGSVMAQLEMMLGNNVLGTCSIRICVEPNPAVGVLKSEDYINWVQWMEDEVVKRVNAVLARGNEFVGPAGPVGLPGENGGWYEPAVSQTDANTVEFTFIPSKVEIPAVVPTHVKLPAGKDGYTPVRGVDYWTEEDQTEIICQVQQSLAPVILCPESGNLIVLTDSADRKLGGLTLFGKTTQDGTPTPEAPVPLESVGESVNVTVAGKNLLQNVAVTKTVSGVTFTVNEDGSVVVNGTATAAIFYHVSNPIKCVPGVTYRLTGCPKDGDMNKYYLYRKCSNSLYANDVGSGTTFVSPNDDLNNVIILVQSGVTVNNAVFYPMLRLADNGDDYFESCKAQNILVTTSNGLPGIPVDSDGNYTDENGQQWICDEVDFARGVYVQRIGAIESYAGEEVFTMYMSTTGELSEGASVLYTLGEAIETALTGEERTAYAALHTNYPNTTVFNDGEAGMEVKYAADTKLYIDKKLGQLATMLAEKI